MKKLICTAFFALALGAGAANAAEVFVGIGPRFGPPPPPRHVMVMRPGPRHVWVPGYYRWNRGRYTLGEGLLDNAAAAARRVGTRLLGPPARRLYLDWRLLAVRGWSGTCSTWRKSPACVAVV